MRVGSIGTFAPINSYKNTNAKNNTSFKADIRLAKGTNVDSSDLSEEDAKQLFKAIVNTMIEYKNKGSDNFLIYLKPVFTEGSWISKPKANIEITGLYKDPDLAVKEIRDYIRKNPEEAKKSISYTNGRDTLNFAKKILKDNPQKARETYQEFSHQSMGRQLDEKGCTVTEEQLKNKLDFLIDLMKYKVPQDGIKSTPFCWEKKSAYDIEDSYPSSEEDFKRLCDKYPEWEKDLWKKIDFDYEAEIYETGEIYSY